MSQSGFTPIQLYRSSTAATLPVAGNLVAGELAINTTDEKLYFENTGGTVTLLASSAAASGTFTTVTATTVVNGLGAVGTPSYTFTGDLNTGMWSPAADTIAFSEGGAEAMRISSAGNVGIGSTAPSAKLDVVAAAFTGGPLIGARYNTANFRMGFGIANANGFPFVGHNVNNSADDNGTFDLNGRASRLRMDSGTFQFETSSASGTAGNAITWNNSAYLDASGNLGIGTTAPATKLTVTDGAITAGAVGDVLIGRNSSGFPTTGAGYFKLRTINDDGTSGGIAIDTLLSGTLSERMRITAAGAVAIGTSTPGGALKLDVSGNGRFIGNLDVYNVSGGPVNSGFLNFGSGALSNAAAIYSQTLSGTAGDLILATAQTGTGTITERVRVDSSGNVGIGNTAPNTKLDVSGSITSRSGSIIADTLTNYGANLVINAAGSLDTIFQTNGTERMRLVTGGGFGIGTNSPTTGSTSNTATLNAGIFITHRGSVSATTAVATTLAVANSSNNVTYIVSCCLQAGDPVNYNAVAIVSGDAGVFRVTTLQTAALMAISVSGTNIQATQTSGGTQPIQFCITRIS